jgi:hypothetical protein
MMLVGGAAGAGIGSYGHDNWGWNKDAIWQGAAAGGAGGYGIGSMSAGGAGSAASGAGAQTGNMSQLASAGSAWMAPSAGSYAAAGAPTVAGAGWSNALTLGQAGMGLMSAFSSSGQTPQTKVELSKSGKKLEEETLIPAIKSQYAKAIAGDADDKAFGAISNLKSQEATRARASTSVLAKAQGAMANTRTGDRGGMAMGGAMLKTQIADAGERMDGLFAPTSALNSFTKEGLMNSVAQIQNLQNRKNNVGQFNYQGNLAAWGANQMAASNKGAAIGGAAMLIGGSQLNQAYMKQYSNAMA